ncbi:hypothetical protein CLV84_0273 [Neolewinella xylanilytica]|uniref:Uncharacterized protein n=2 Tax=Neolewinella xylanilytica TaxID=1514080 RepID=A0A2S6I754_9BACT|nr:hypothetical protein CLV84_0273 [Neolewinella xylanilytica]
MACKAMACAMILLCASSCHVFKPENRPRAGISRQQLFTATANVGGVDKVLPTMFWSHYDATQRGGVYLVMPDGTVKVLAENPPDVALSSAITTLAKAKVKDEIEAEAKLTAITSVAELGSRNAANYMIRDLAFRIEALQNNTGGIDPAVIDLYKELLTVAESVSASENISQSDVARSEEITAIIKLIETLNDPEYNGIEIDPGLIDSMLRNASER